MVSRCLDESHNMFWRLTTVQGAIPIQLMELAPEALRTTAVG